jgi:hypothetical protein
MRHGMRQLGRGCCWGDFSCYNDDHYLNRVSICRYRSSDTVFQALTSKASPERLPRIPYDIGQQPIKESVTPILFDDDLIRTPAATTSRTFPCSVPSR